MAENGEGAHSAPAARRLGAGFDWALGAPAAANCRHDSLRFPRPNSARRGNSLLGGSSTAERPVITRRVRVRFPLAPPISADWQRRRFPLPPNDKNLEATSGFSAKRVQQARAVLRHWRLEANVA
jgi:hypothetical protein